MWYDIKVEKLVAPVLQKADGSYHIMLRSQDEARYKVITQSEYNNLRQLNVFL